jgi:DNA-binding NarL/FixJ family response regulator
MMVMVIHTVARPPSDRAEVRGEDSRPTIAIHATDAIVKAGAAAYLRSQPGIILLPAGAAYRADVIVVFGELAGGETLAWMQQMAEQKAVGERRFVLISDEAEGPQLRRAGRCGLISVLSRKGCRYEHIVRAVLGLYQGRVELPAAGFRALLAWSGLEPVQAGPLAPVSENVGHLDAREHDVLRLLADGFSSAEIASRLNYSERTVKNVIYRLLTRLNLRNRSHAVAFMFRSGLL